MSSTTSELVTHKQFIRAGAGAGKTRRLVETFYSFAKEFHFKNKRWPKVVLTTFTKKATQEIKERLLKHAIQNNDAEFVSYLGRTSLVQISTIHLLLQNILFRFHDRIGLINQIQIIEDSEELNQIFKIIKNEFVSSEEFIELVDHFRLSELKFLIRDCIRQLKEFPDFKYVKVEELKQMTAEKMKNLHFSWSVVLAEINPYRSSLSADWQNYLMFVESYLQLIKENQIEAAIKFYADLPDKPRFSKTKPAFPVEIHEKLRELHDDDRMTPGFTDTESFFTMYQVNHELFQRLLEQVFKKWQQIQKSTGQITISDLELMSLQIAQSYPNELSEFAKQIDFIMLDEYQDTSPLQVKILQLIIDQTNVFIVGDPQQSIYLFRGARTEVFLNQELRSQNSQFEMTRLQNNYRSHPEVLQFFNDYFTEQGPQFVAMQPGRENSPSQSLTRVQFVETEDQLLSVVLKVLQLRRAGVDFKDIAVLSRGNSELLKLNSLLKSHGIPADLLTAAGLERKREILDSVCFLKFIINPFDDENLFKLLRSPWFNVSDSDLYSIRKWQKEKKAGSLWISLKNFNHDVFDRLQIYLDLYLQFGFLLAFEKFIFDEKLLTHSFVLDESGRMESNLFKFFQMLYEKSLSTGFDLNKFVNDKSFSDNSLDSNGKSESLPAAQTAAVNLLTIHGSKGLQFKHVIVIGMNDLVNTIKFMPMAVDEQRALYALALTNPSDGKKVSHDWAHLLRNNKNQRTMEESDRLLYVALTRAEESICLISEDRSKKFANTWKSIFYWPLFDSNRSVHNFKNSKIYTERHEKISELIMSYTSPVNVKKNSNQDLKIYDRQIQKPYVPLSVSDLLGFDIAGLNQLEKTSTFTKERRDSSYKISENLIDAQTKALAGTRAHTLFESIKYNRFLEDPELMHSLTADESAAVQYLHSQKDLPFQEIMEHGHVEFGFKLKVAHYVIQGQIDAWGKVGSKVYLIDYKTGDQKYTDKAFAQLNLYAQCLMRIGQIKSTDQIFLAAIFPFEKKTVIQTITNL